MYLKTKSLHALLGWRQHRHPVVDDGSHNHIEEHEGQGVALIHSVVPFEQ